MSLEQIATAINEKGYRTKQGRKFTPNSFYGWANNRKYKGDYTWDVSSKKKEDGTRNTNKRKPLSEQTIIKNSIPPIVEPDLWDEMNTIMQNRKLKPGTMKAKVCYLLSGKIICGKCGSLYAGNSYKNKKSKDNTLLSYYKCSGKCGNTNIRKQDIEQNVLQNIHEICFTKDAIQEVIKKVLELYHEQRGNSGNEIVVIEKNIQSLETSISNWIDALGKGIKGLEEKILDAQNRVEALHVELIKIKSSEQMPREINEKFIRTIVENKKHLLESADEADKKEVLQEYVEQVVIQPSNDISHYHTVITYRVFIGGGEGI